MELERRADHQLLLLGLITLVAIALRFYRLGEWSFWVDETFTVRRALGVLPAGMDVSTMLIRLALSGLGTNEWSARVVPAIVGVVTIPALYFPIRQMFGPVIALLTALFLAISPWHIYFSQNSRYYTALLLFFTLGLLAFFHGVEQNRPWYILVSLSLLGLAYLERAYALFFIPIVLGQLGWLMVLPFKKPSWLHRRKGVLLICPPIVGALYLAFSIATGQDHWVLSALIPGFYGRQLMEPQWLLTDFVYRVGVPLHTLAVIGCIYLLREKKTSGLFLALAAWAPLVALMVLSLSFRTFTHYAAVSLPFIIILGAVGVKETFRLARRHSIVALPCVFVIGLLLTKDPLVKDALYYLGGRSQAPAVATLGLLLLLGVTLRTPRSGTRSNRYGGMSVRNRMVREVATAVRLARLARGHSGVLVWSLSIFLPLLAHPGLASFLYYENQHGYRNNWIDAAAIILDNKTDGDVVITSEPETATLYFGENGMVRSVPDDLDAALRDSQRVWLVEDYGMEKLLEGTVEEWAETNCEIVSILDHFAGGRNWKMRIHLCDLIR